MSLVNVLIGLVAAVAVFVVFTAFVVFPHSVLIFALLAIAVFVLIAFSGRTFIRR